MLPRKRKMVVNPHREIFEEPHHAFHLDSGTIRVP
jgi:hypothetical protein